MSRPPSPITPSAAAAATRFYHSTLSSTFHKNRNDAPCGVSFMDESRELQQSPHYHFRVGDLTNASFRSPDPETLQDDIRELEMTKRHLQEKNAELNCQIQNCEDANNSLRKHCQHLEEALKGIQQQVRDKEKLEEDIRELQCLLDSEREEKLAAEEKIFILKKEKCSLEAQLEDEDIELKCCQEENESLRQRVGDLVKEKENESMLFRSLVEQLENKLREEVKMTEILKEENESLHANIGNLQEELGYYKEKLSTLSLEYMQEVNTTVEEDDLQINAKSKSAKTPWTPNLFTSCSANTSATETPGSIRSEIEMMSDNDGSQPFCGKSDLDPLSSSEKGLTLPDGKGDAASLQLLINILNCWRENYKEGEIPPKDSVGGKDSALYSHFLKHYDVLLKLEKGLQNIAKKKQLERSPRTTPTAQRQTPGDSSVGTISPEVDLGIAESPTNLQTPSPSVPRTPGSLVSNLIHKFENSSLSPSITFPTSSEKKRNAFKDSGSKEKCDGQVAENYLRDSKILSRSNLILPESADEKLDNNSNLISHEQNNEDITDSTSENASECLTGSLPQSCNASDVLDSGFEQDTGYSVLVAGTQPIYDSGKDTFREDDESEHSPEQTENDSFLLSGGFDMEDSQSEKDQEIGASLRRKLLWKVHTPSKDGDTQLEMSLDLESDAYMKQSHLMKLTQEVQEHEALLKEAKQQLAKANEEIEGSMVMFVRIFRLASQVSGDVFRWIDSVRKEWLSTVPVARQDEGTISQLRTPDPLYDLPLTGTHSREEIESLINTRCDLGCQSSHDELGKDYVNPENLAIELERELLALKLHVARSHALLHHYQSSSLHGSHSEVSTPPAATSTPHVQGVEAGVEVDLCGPTCIPKPCDSTATQTPASPISASPECEEASVAEEASVTLSNEGGGEDPLLDDHRSLTQQHRPLYQRMSLSEEEVEEESPTATEMAVSSDHVIYAPKPTYDQLDQYSVKPKKSEEKHRRTGLPIIHAQIGRRGVGDGGNDQSSDSEDEGKRREESLSASSRLARLPPFNRHPRCHSDPAVAPLSPPPSLDMEEEEEDDEEETGLLVKRRRSRMEEEEPELPSTPESGPSNASVPGDIYLATPAYATLSAMEMEKEEATARLHLQPGVNGVETPLASAPPPNQPPPSENSNNHSSSSPVSADAAMSQEDSTDGTVPPSESVFPSLSDSHLRAFGVSVDDPSPYNENLSAQEIENKFKQLSLAFKTDRLTLRQRLDVQHRQRDIAEANFERELAQLRRYISDLHEECIDMELVDAIMQVRKHIEVLTMSSSSLLSASEVWGAVQQEWRVSRALEVLLLHVENVNRLYEHDHQELEEMRKLLSEHQIEFPSSSGSASSNQSSSTDSTNASRRIRALSLAGLGKQSTENGNRRISIGPGLTKTVLNQYLGGRNSRRRASMMPDLRPFELTPASIESLAAKAASCLQEKDEEKSHSNKGMMNSSITEEGSESGDEAMDNGGQESNCNSPTAATLRRLNNYPLYGQPTQDSDQMTCDDQSPTPTHSPDTDPLTSTNSMVNFMPHSQNWVMQNLEELYYKYRNGNLPYTNQQVLRGVFTSFLLLVAVFYLVLATSSAHDDLAEPCRPDWTFKALKFKYHNPQPF